MQAMLTLAETPLICQSFTNNLSLKETKLLNQWISPVNK